MSETVDKVVITGATSMLGLALIDACICRGIRVVAVVRANSPRRGMLPQSPLVSAVECGLWELGEADIPQAADSDVFYHLAWAGTDAAQRADVMLQQRNLAAALDAVNLAARLGCRRFVGAGSQAEYGRRQGVIDEKTATAPETAYGVAKFAAGRLGQMYGAQLGLDFVWTRIFSVYGPNGADATMITYCIDSLLAGETPKLTKCEQRWDYLYSADAGEALFAVGQSGAAGGCYNIGSGGARPLAEYVHILRDAVDPALALGIGQLAYAPGQVMELCADISQLRRDTSFTVRVPFEEGIAKTVAARRALKREGNP